jgi:methyl-accepting chemotaxis protein
MENQQRSSLEEELRQCREDIRSLQEEKRSLQEALEGERRQRNEETKSIQPLARQCHCVVQGGEISRTLTSIVQEKTKEATLELTNRVYSILETSDELNSTIQRVIGGLSDDEDGLKKDVTNLEGEQAKVEDLINDFTQIRDGYAREIGNIEESMKSIRNFVDSINDIADRTNILAINATIEAARAGKAGEGFAVIGSEIQDLAQSTMKIAEQITGTIEDASSEVSNSVERYGNKIDSAVNRLETTGSTHSKLVEKLNPHVENLSEIAQTSSTLSSTVQENVNEMAKHLQYQDRIKQIIAHLIEFLEELGKEARSTASSHARINEEEVEQVKAQMMEKAAALFSTDEEYDAFGYDKNKVETENGKAETAEEMDGNVVLF